MAAKKWRSYERFVARLMAEEHSENEFTVIPNARIKGYITQRKRQLDVLIDFRYRTDITRRIIVDAKDRKRPVDVKDVEAFEGMMKDVQAARGILVCSNGYTKAALRRAQNHIGIRLLSAEETENIDLYSWDNCLNEKCGKGLVLWDANPGIFYDEVWHVHGIGKCDECGHFHVWCWGCGQQTSIGNEDDWKCGCNTPWFWFTLIEDEDEDESESFTMQIVYLTVMPSGKIVDRRSL